MRRTVLSITALADAPVNTVPGAKSVNEDVTLPIAGMSVADVDTATLTTTLTVLNGRLHVTAGAGVSDNDTATVTITGTAAETNTALAGLSYTGNLNFNGPDTLTVTTGDGTARRTPTRSRSRSTRSTIGRCAISTSTIRAAGPGGLYDNFHRGRRRRCDRRPRRPDRRHRHESASATITLANPRPADLLSVVGTLPAGITASAYDPATGVLTLSGAATLAAYQAALRQITFGNSSPVPSATDRVVNIVVNDGAASSVAAHAFLRGPGGYGAGAGPRCNDSSGATGRTTPPYSPARRFHRRRRHCDRRCGQREPVIGDDHPDQWRGNRPLAVNGTLPPGITGAFDPATGIFTLTGSAPLAAYQAALRQIEFGSSDPNPLTATRIIEVVVNDGTTDSSVASSLIQIALAASPTLDLDADDSTASGSDYATTFTEGSAGVRSRTSTSCSARRHWCRRQSP